MRLRYLASVIPLLLLCSCATPLTQEVEKNHVYVLGSVGKEVALDYAEGMTILDALGKAGFPSKDALRMHVRWVDKSGPLIQRRSFSYNAVIKGRATNQAVHPGDIIYLYRHPVYVVLDFVERLLQPVRSVLSAVAPAAAN